MKKALLFVVFLPCFAWQKFVTFLHWVEDGNEYDPDADD